ncbi:MAG: nicotinate-nucleotide diphosphorylase (carboxylating), partial [Actinobacteria bacterium]|nr:nicotinate-nucleotide diphosphorylase (carboxylating) [Actinomycetota bacterium]
MDMYSLSTETGALLEAGGLSSLYIEDVIENTILEDLDGGIDVTSVATVPLEQRSVATFGSRADGCVSGLIVAAAVIEMVCGPHASSIDY